MATRHNSKRDKVKHSAGGRAAKKGGSGGKHVWGSTADDIRYAGVDVSISKGDPNYDSEDDNGDDLHLSSVVLDEEMNFSEFKDNMEVLQAFKSALSKLANDFLRDNDKSDAARFKKFIAEIQPLLDAHPLPRLKPQIGKVLMSKGFDYNAHSQELVSSLLKRLADESIISGSDIVASVNEVLSRLHDYMLDVPNVATFVDGYVKRAVDAELIPADKAKSYFDILGTSHDTRTIKDLKSKVVAMLGEYLRSEDIDNLSAEVDKLDALFYHKFIVKYAVSMSLDKHDHERELVSKILAHIKTSDDTPLLKQEEVEEGFLLLLNQIEDLSEDVPEVGKFLAYFIARAIHDECLAPKFLHSTPFMEGDYAFKVLQQANKLLDHKKARLARIWGPSAVQDLQGAVHALVVDFFSSSNQDAAHRSIVALDAPHFHHEIVRQLFRMCAEKYEKEMANVGELLSLLVKEGVIAETEIAKGLKRVEEKLEELTKGQPLAETMLSDLRESLGLKVHP